MGCLVSEVNGEDAIEKEEGTWMLHIDGSANSQDECPRILLQKLKGINLERGQVSIHSDHMMLNTKR